MIAIATEWFIVAGGFAGCVGIAVLMNWSINRGGRPKR